MKSTITKFGRLFWYWKKFVKT